MQPAGHSRPPDALEPIDLSGLDQEFEKAKPEVRSFEAPPDGKYQVIVEHVELARSVTADNPMLKWRLRILSPEHIGRLLFRNTMLVTPANMLWLKKDLETCGLMLNKVSDLPARLGELNGIALEVQKHTRGSFTNIYFRQRIEPVNGPAGYPKV